MRLNMSVPPVNQAQVNAIPNQQIPEGPQANIVSPEPPINSVAKEAIKGAAGLCFLASTGASGQASKAVVRLKFPVQAPALEPAIDATATLAAGASSKVFNAFVDSL